MINWFICTSYQPYRQQDEYSEYEIVVQHQDQ